MEKAEPSCMGLHESSLLYRLGVQSPPAPLWVGNYLPVSVTPSMCLA